MNFRIIIDPVGIFSTGAAVDNATVFGSLKMARAALDEAVTAELIRAKEVLKQQIGRLEFDWAVQHQAMRAQRKLALKVRESDLPSDATIPVAGPLPAAPAAAVSPSTSGSHPAETATSGGIATPEPQASDKADGQSDAATECDHPPLAFQIDSAGKASCTKCGSEILIDTHRPGEPTAGTGDGLEIRALDW